MAPSDDARPEVKSRLLGDALVHTAVGTTHPPPYLSRIDYCLVYRVKNEPRDLV